VGDPFKDTAGPCINILVKLMSMVSIVFAGLIVSYALHVDGINAPMSNAVIESARQNSILYVDAAKAEANPCQDCKQATADCFEKP
jgi:K(+)-stimulated pyrophosphate-energized sodium pump